VASSRAVPLSQRGSGFFGLRVASLGIAALFAVPFLYLVVENVTTGDSPWTFLTAEGLGPLLRSVVLALAVSVAATVLGTAAAWLVAWTDLPGKRLWRILLPLPLVIPSFIGAFIMISTFAPGGLLQTLLSPLGIESIPAVRGFLGAFLVLTLFTYPYVYLPVAARLRQLPSSLEESSRLLGAGAWPTFFRVVLPQARGGVLAGSLLVFLYSISDFGVVQLMRYDALTRVIYATRLFDRTTSIALTLQLGLLALLIVATERIVTAHPTQARTSRAASALVVPLRRYRALGITFVAGLVIAALAVPVGVLIFWAIRGFVQDSLSGVLVTTSIVRPILNTAVVSVLAAVVAAIVVLPIAYLTVRHRSRIGDVSNAVVVGGFALPGLAIALSMVYLTVSRPLLSPLYQTLILLIAAYVIHFGAQAMRASQVALSGVPTSLEDAAQVLGVRRWHRFVRVELPLMRPGLLAGAGLVLLNAMKELPATLLLAPAGFQTLAMKIWQASESAFFSDAAVAALILIALSGILTWVLVIRRAEGTS
jgi:iron(III) transport system permease protein